MSSDLMKPTIRSDDKDIIRLQRRAWSALDNRRPRTVFRRAADLVRVAVSKLGAIIQELTPPRLCHELNRAANWQRVVRRQIEKSRAPKHLLDDMLAHPNPPMPVLARVVQMPVFTSTGQLIATPGYHDESGIFMVAPSDLEGYLDAFQDIAHPSREEVQSALDQLHEPLRDFPFVSDADRAHALALILLPFVRELIEGPTPLNGIFKPAPGTGGTLLAEIINLIATGAPLEVTTLTDWEQEQQRTITAMLFKGPTYLLLDNIHGLDSSPLAAAITSITWSDRKMGSSDAPSMPVRCGWIATGNNPQLSKEMIRRTVLTRLDAQMAHPEDRTAFRHPDLRTFVKEQRPHLIAAVITLVRAWQAAGTPPGKKTLGMFESWAQVIGGILSVAGVPGFLDNLDDLRQGTDIGATSWREFVSRWVGRYGLKTVGVSNLWELIDNPDPLDLGFDRTKDVPSQKTSFGQKLVGRRGQVIGEYRLIEEGERHRAKQWRLALVHEPPGEPSGEPASDTFTVANSL
jgi:putative DNA primase/helicase